MQNAADLARDVDPTRPVSIDILSYPNIPRQSTYDAFDVLGINSYYGWYKGKKERSTERLRRPRAVPARDARQVPRQGARDHRVRRRGVQDPGQSNVKQTFAFQTQYLKRNLDIVDRLGFMGGAIYWTAREFAVKPDWDGGGGSPGQARLVSSQGADLLRRQDQAGLRRRQAGVQGGAACAPRRPRRRGPRRAVGRRVARPARAAVHRRVRGGSPPCSRSTPGACATSGAPGAGARRTARGRSSSCPPAAWRSGHPASAGRSHHLIAW